MKLSLTLVALLAASPALAATKKVPVPTPRPAEVISCGFTEPFFSIEFNEEYGLVKTMRADDMEEEEETGDYIYKVRHSYGYKKIRTGKNTFEIRNDKGRVALELVLDFNGNDGMSEIITPYSGKALGFEGGCSSNYYNNDKSLN